MSKSRSIVEQLIWGLLVMAWQPSGIIFQSEAGTSPYVSKGRGYGLLTSLCPYEYHIRKVFFNHRLSLSEIVNNQTNDAQTGSIHEIFFPFYPSILDFAQRSIQNPWSHY